MQLRGMDRSLLFLIHVILWNLRKTKDLVNALHQVGELVLSIAAKEFAVPMILMNHEETDEAMVMRCLIALVLIVLKSLFKCQEAFVDVLREAEGAVIKFCMESERPRVAVIMSAPARWCELDLNLLEEICVTLAICYNNNFVCIKSIRKKEDTIRRLRVSGERSSELKTRWIV